MATVTLNVSGKLFTIAEEVIRKYPSTRLGSLTKESPEYDSTKKQYYFDRNPKLMWCILDWYRTDELHLPEICPFAIEIELEYWQIDKTYVSECCWKKFSCIYSDMRAVDLIERALCIPYNRHLADSSMKYRLWLIMEYPNYSVYSKIWFALYIAVVCLSVIIACLSMSPMLRHKTKSSNQGNVTKNNETLWEWIQSTEKAYEAYVVDMSCLTFFTLEILARSIICPYSAVNFMRNPMHALDIFLTSVMWLSSIADSVPRNHGLYVVHNMFSSLFCLNILRMFHLVRGSNGLQLLAFTIGASFGAFFFMLASITMAVVVFATLAYFAEVASSTDTFETIPAALWWAIVTMTTVGYGDYIPKSFPGYLVAILCALWGILLLAMPIAIISDNFHVYYGNVDSAIQRITRRQILSKRRYSLVESSDESILIPKPIYRRRNAIPQRMIDVKSYVDETLLTINIAPKKSRINKVGNFGT